MTNCSTEISGPAAPRRTGRWILLALLWACAVGCHRDEIKVFRVAKDQNQPQSQSAPPVSTDSPNPALPPGHPDISAASGAALPAAAESAQTQLTWTTPEGWTEVPASEMRVASFKIQGANGKQADVSVIPLAGLSGSSDDANANRWRGQVGLPPVSADELKKSAESVETGGEPAQLFDIVGKNPSNGEDTRILGVIQHRPDAVWFFKMTGDAELAEQQKPAFIALLKSVKFTPAAAPAGLPPAHPPIGDMGMGVPATAAPISNEGKPNWQVPAGWQEISGGQFLVAKFTLTGEDGATAAVNVSSSAGNGGGLAGNVNRWRGQLGLGQLSEDDVNKLVTTIESAGVKASLVEMSGTDPRTSQPVQLVGVMVPQSGQTWFYKLMGNPKVVAGQKDAFTKFVQGVKY